MAYNFAYMATLSVANMAALLAWALETREVYDGVVRHQVQRFYNVIASLRRPRVRLSILLRLKWYAFSPLAICLLI